MVASSVRSGARVSLLGAGVGVREYVGVSSGVFLQHPSKRCWIRILPAARYQEQGSGWPALLFSAPLAKMAKIQDLATQKGDLHSPHPHPKFPRP